MRISSSFTEDNLYSRHSRRTKGKSPHRLLMRLILAMILVIAVMRQAGNPRIYEAFFPPPVVDITTQSPPIAPLPPAGPGAGGLIVDRDLGIGLSEPIFAHAEKMMRVLAEQLDQALVLLGDEKNAELMTLLAQWRTTGDVEKPVLSDEWADQLNEAFTQAGQTRQAGENHSGENQIEPPDWTAAPVVPLLQPALDRWAIARVDPAAVWKGVDTLGFYRLLEDDPGQRPLLRSLQGDTASRTSVISLIQQPDAYLRRRVVLPASVARVVRRPAAKNPFGVQQYWEVWLRPRDGSERPFVMFTGEVSETIAAIGPDSALADGPQVWVDGIFLKRIAYQSSLGRELAPAIVGTLHEPAASTDLAVAVSAPSPTQGWMLVVLSAVIGFSAAAVIFFQSGKAIARSRALRRKTCPPAPPFLAALDQADRCDGEPGEAFS